MTATPQTTPQLKVWDASTRGFNDIGWLRSAHSFSFGHFQDPSRMGFRALRVINDDYIKGGAGFGMHPHREMEILTWVLDGKVAHKDSTGMSGTIVPGDLQLMSAGTGIRHSEMNGLQDETTHLLQIWIEPGQLGVEPGYQQTSFDLEGRSDRWQLLASPDARDGSLKIHADATVSVSVLSEGHTLETSIGEGRHGYLHIARGKVTIDGRTLVTGDAVSWAGGTPITLRADESSEVLLFDLA